jgi:FeS assembly SUF system regulator
MHAIAKATQAPFCFNGLRGSTDRHAPQASEWCKTLRYQGANYPGIDRAGPNQYHFSPDSSSSGLSVPMLRVSRLTDYATVVMTCIAAHPDNVLSTVQIADETRLELPTVSKLLKALGHAALVESFRGVNGGYRLARPATEISLAEIVEALEGPIGMTECSVAEGQCDRESQCGVRGSWQQINSVLDHTLRAVSLADMLKPPPSRPAPVRPASIKPIAVTLKTGEATTE